MENGSSIASHVYTHDSPLPLLSAAELRSKLAACKARGKRCQSSREFFQILSRKYQADLDEAEAAVLRGGAQAALAASEVERYREDVERQRTNIECVDHHVAKDEQEAEELQRQLVAAEAMETIEARGERGQPPAPALRRV